MASWLPVMAAVKEARLQNPVLTHRNGIRGIVTRVSNHVLAMPKEDRKGSYVDAAGIGGRKMFLPGEIQVFVLSTIHREVSRGHSSYGNEPVQITGGLTKVVKD